MNEIAEATPQTTEYQGFTINLPPQVMETVDAYAHEFLKKGRGDFDPTHTEAAVYYALVIGSYYGLDLTVLYTAARLHDIGYAGQADDGQLIAYEAVQAAKGAHMEVGEERAEEFLNRDDIRDHFTQAQKYLIVHLVLVHDNVEDLKTLYEIIIMEADTLAAISLNALDHITVITTFGYPDGKRYIEKDLLGRRHPQFKTYPGKLFFEVLSPEFEKYYDAQKPVGT